MAATDQLTDEQLAALGLAPPPMPAIAGSPAAAPLPPDVDPLPASSLGDKIAPGAQIPKSQMKDALAAGGITGQQSYEAGRPKIPALPPITSDPSSLREWQNARQAQLGAKSAQMEYDKSHPWGSIISPHPGILGTIGHVASRIGNVAGDILAPGITANIPGSDLYKQREQEGLSGEMTKIGEDQSRQAQTAATEEATKEAPEKLELDKEKAAAALVPKEGKTTDEQVLHDLMTGDSGRPRVNPQTQKPYTYLEAYTAVKQAAQDTKAPTGNDFEQFYRQKVKEGLPDTSANRQSAYAQWVKNEPQYQAAAAQRDATNADRNEKRQERQGQSVYAYDAASGRTRMMREQEALDQGLMYDKASAKQVAEDRQMTNRLGDVQQKIGRYEQTLDKDIGLADKNALAQILGEDKFKLGVSHIELPVDFLNKISQAYLKGQLSKEAEMRLIAYTNAREAMVGYQRVLSGSGRSSDQAMQLNLQALPDPLTPGGYAKEALNQFKENLRLVSQGLPEIPGVKHPADIEKGFAKPQVFKVGKDVYDVPADKLEAFKKKFPNAIAQ